MDLATLSALVIALLLGAALGWLAARGGSRAELAEARAIATARQESETDLRRSLQLLGQDAAQRQSAQVGHRVDGAVAPLRDAVGSLAGHLERAELARGESDAGLREQVTAMRAASESLTTQTARLVTALRTPQVRGRWGEVQLRRVVELSGMAEHCDFVTQSTGSVDRGDTTAAVRPDLVVRLTGGRTIVLDAKVPLQAFLDALDADDEAGRAVHLRSHARAVRAHVDQLAGKKYWRSQADTPEFVVLFLPGDPFLEGALAADPDLLEHAFTRDVVIATPTTLIALLRTVAHGWRQDGLHRDAAEVLALGRELHARVAAVGGTLDDLGGQLTRAVDSYNRTVGSMESRVLVTARRLTALGVSADVVPEPRQVDRTPRRLQAPELVAGSDGPIPGGSAEAPDVRLARNADGDRRAG